MKKSKLNLTCVLLSMLIIISLHQSNQQVADSSQTEDDDHDVIDQGADDDERPDDQQSDQEEEDENVDHEDNQDGKEEMPTFMPLFQAGFNFFRELFGFKYKEPEERTYRYEIFKKNSERIQRHNNDPSKQYKRGITSQMDKQPKQFLSSVLMELPRRYPQYIGDIVAPPSFEFKAVDWRPYISEVNDQESGCASGYAFSVVSVLQAYYKIIYDQIVNYSEQQIIDCCFDGCDGCKGGWPSSALDYLVQQGVLEESVYPYRSRKQRCQKKQPSQYNKILNEYQPYSQVRSLKSLQFALQSGPVNVMVDASSWDPLYKSGIFNLCPKTNFFFNHAVVCAGVNDNGVWIVRNSWGRNWGVRGYIFLAAGNSCGIANRGVVPNLGNAEDNQEQEFIIQNQSEQIKSDIEFLEDEQNQDLQQVKDFQEQDQNNDAQTGSSNNQDQQQQNDSVEDESIDTEDDSQQNQKFQEEIIDQYADNQEQ